MKPADVPPPFLVPTILVIAPDDDLRRSLAFLLTAEGFAVASAEAWPPAVMGQPDAVIIDHGALAKPFVDDGRLAGLGGRLIVLTGREGRMPPLPQAVTVSKPLLDCDLLDALCNVLTLPLPRD